MHHFLLNQLTLSHSVKKTVLIADTKKNYANKAFSTQ